MWADMPLYSFEIWTDIDDKSNCVSSNVAIWNSNLKPCIWSDWVNDVNVRVDRASCSQKDENFRKISKKSICLRRNRLTIHVKVGLTASSMRIKYKPKHELKVVNSSPNFPHSKFETRFCSHNWTRERLSNAHGCVLRSMLVVVEREQWERWQHNSTACSVSTTVRSNLLIN